MPQFLLPVNNFIDNSLLFCAGFSQINPGSFDTGMSHQMPAWQYHCSVPESFSQSDGERNINTPQLSPFGIQIQISDPDMFTFDLNQFTGTDAQVDGLRLKNSIYTDNIPSYYYIESAAEIKVFTFV